MRPNFDTQRLARELEKSGLSPDASDAIVDAMREAQVDLVTKDDLKASVLALQDDLKIAVVELRSEITKLEEKITKLDGKVETQIAQLDGKVETQIARLETQIAQAMHKQTIWLLGGMGALLGIAVAIQHFIK